MRSPPLLPLLPPEYPDEETPPLEEPELLLELPADEPLPPLPFELPRPSIMSGSFRRTRV